MPAAADFFAAAARVAGDAFSMTTVTSCGPARPSPGPPHTWPPRGAWRRTDPCTSLHLSYSLASGSPMPAARRSPGAPPGAMSGSSRGRASWRRRPVGRGADPLQGQGVARPLGKAGGRPGRRREERGEAPKRRLPPRHAARGRRAPRHERGGPRRHAALPGGLRVGPRRSQGAQDQGRRGAAGRRGTQERLPAVAQLPDSATVRRHLGRAARRTPRLSSPTTCATPQLLGIY